MPWCPCGFIIAVYLDLSSSRGGGFFYSLRRGNLSGAARQLPLTRGALGTGVEKPPLVKGRCRAERGGEVPRREGRRALRRGGGEAGTKKRPPEGPLLSA